MKIIISHDVDHLFRTDHFNDLIYPKLWIRETLAVLKIRGNISIKEWFLRMCSPFSKERHHIFDVIDFDKKNNVPSVFFFGMANGLGMSYSQKKVVNVIKEVLKRGFSVGVHGIEYQDKEKMLKEYYDFKKIVGFDDFGIRMHYVRFDDATFIKLSEIGYKYDTTEFDKTIGSCLKSPYKVNDMWEFPLCCMDGYVSSDLEEKKKETIELINKAIELKLPFFTLLFHDIQFCEAYKTERDWYVWFINYCIKNEYEFVSYEEAVKDMETKK